jgi:hypothetical protein
METFQPDDDERWQRAVAGRLAKLRTTPVDTGRLGRALGSEIPRPAAARAARWFSPRAFRAVAAGIVLAGAVAAAVLLATAGGAALASPAQVARMHEELVAGQAPAVRVDSIEAANRVLSGGADHPPFPDLPDMPADHVMACCMRSVKDKKVACLLMKRDDVPVSLMVARSRDVRAPTSAVISRRGASYRVQSMGDLNMVMTERNDRWVCLVARLPAERLMDIADQLKF